MQWQEFSNNLRHLSPADQLRIERAYQLGKKLHEGQTRKSGEPYFTHPIAIAVRLAFIGADADTIIAALLHDIIEDTSATLEEIKREFNGDVSMLIDGVTKLSAAEFEEQPNLNEQIETLRKIFRLMQQDLRIIIIKLFDRLHNMETIQFLLPEKQILLAQETSDVYVKIADRLCMQDLRYELEGICIAILEPALYQRLVELRNQGKELSKVIAEKMLRFIEAQENLRDKVKVHFEFKSWQKLRAQHKAGGSAATGVANATMVFVCADRDTCYRVMGAIHEPWKREAMSFQDFINSPMINGYRGLHTTVILEDGTRVRCKIRTREMQEYARKGVTTMCFKPEQREELEKLLPWTQRINSVAEDTRDHSQNFWQSLQSDILGESITLHGPADRTAQLPQGATALDGAFYLFEDDALSVQSIRINGKEAPFYIPVTHAMTLDPTFAKMRTVNRQWLRWVQTGYATARIRTALTEESEQKRIIIGNEMLQAIMLERKKGFIEEFNAPMLDNQARLLGYKSLDDVYIAIADGRLDVIDAYSLLFRENTPTAKENQLPQRVEYTINLEDTAAIDQLNQVHKNYHSSISEIRYRRVSRVLSQVILKMKISMREAALLRENLSLAGAKNVEVILQTKREVTLLTIVIALWALNPVAAKWLLGNGMDTLSLLTVRFLVFSLFTIGFFVIWRLATKEKFTPIPRLTALAGLPAFWNAGISTFTYLTLLFLPPSLHLTILRFNTLLLSIKGNGSRKHPLILILLMLLVALCSFFVISGYTTAGVLLSIATLLCYTFYSLSLERTLHQHRIDVRYPYLLFQMGILLGSLGLVLTLFQPIDALWHKFTLLSIAYTFVCVCIPHACYSALLKTTRFRHFTDYFLLEVPLAMLLEAAILGLILPISMYVIVGIVLGTLLLYQWRKSIVTM